MKIKRLISIALIFIMTTLGLPGCGYVTQQPDNQTNNADDQMTTLGLEPDLDYERPVVEAHIEIDQLGYLPNQKKTAIFRGENLSDEFRVVSADTMETVYTGTIESKSVRNSDEEFFYGDFTAFSTEGEYYIQTDVIGYSYKFSISEDLYEGLLETALKQYYFNRCGCSLTEQYAGNKTRTACHTDTVSLKQDASTVLDVTGGWHVDPAGDRDVKRGCDTIETLLMAYEYNTQMFGDDMNIPESGDGIPDILNEICFETQWLLKMQDMATGGVYESVSVIDNGSEIDNHCHIEAVDLSATLYFASAMAYFSYLYQNFDNAYATSCLQAADRAMKYVAKFPGNYNEDEYFRAATMMYRATGYAYYRNIINVYLMNVQEYEMTNNVVFTGCVTYLATRQKTVKTYCDGMIKSLQAYAESISTERGDTIFLMGDKIEETDKSVLLSEIARLTVVNYVISSNEYETLMEKYLHYFLGCNPSNLCYIGQYGGSDSQQTSTYDITKKPEEDAYFVLLLSGVEMPAEVIISQ